MAVTGNALYFDSDAHAALAGTMLGLLLREKDQPRGLVGIIAAHAITDSEGNYKPCSTCSPRTARSSG